MDQSSGPGRPGIRWSVAATPAVQGQTEPGQAEPAVLLAGAATGDQDSREEIVRRYSPLIGAVTRAFRLPAPDAADVSQATWLRLVENLGTIRDPRRLGGWLATTARREALCLLRRDNHTIPAEHLDRLHRDDDQGEPVDQANPARRA